LRAPAGKLAEPAEKEIGRSPFKEIREQGGMLMRSRAAAVAPFVAAFLGGSAAVIASPAIVAPAAMQQIASPDSHLQATITIGDDVRYALTLDGAPLVLPSPVSLSLADGRVFGRDARIVRVDRREISEEIETPIGKRAKVRNVCREVAVVFSNGGTLRARVFDDGFALRWETTLPGRVRVRDEGFSLALPEEANMFFLGGEGAHHGYEGLWRHEPISSLGWSTQTASLPLVVDLPHGLKLGVLQADLDDYPAMYLASRPSQPHTLSAFFPRRVIKEQPGGYLDFLLAVVERADDIAETAGTRVFPWRALVLARRDADLVASDMVTRLAPPPTPGSDFSWVKPGKVVWDYWADWNLEGVDFVAGRNTRTFEFYVDFAAKHGLPYINIDWLWSDPLDLMSLNPEIDVPEIVRYARARNVGVFVWCLTRTLERQLGPAMDRFQQWGVAGLKIDFFDRDDQRMLALYRRFADEAAKRRLMVLFHGATAPWGLSRTLPNVLGYEAVRGLEYDKFNPQGAPPGHDVTLPFTRMLAGPMDYTPGAMRALSKTNWKAMSDLPASQGTVAHQLAMYVVYDAPLAMLADMPTAYEREPAALELLTDVPTTWDETVGVDGRIGESVVVARRKGQEWWIGAMTNWEDRTVEVPLAFTGGGRWQATLWTDGVNAGRVGTDYRRTTQMLDGAEPLRLTLAPGGGAVVRLRRQ
jgi:alpha-glucosidase